MVGKVASVAFRADTLLRFAGEHGAYLHLFYGGTLDALGCRLGDFLTLGHDKLIGIGVNDVVDRHASEYALAERRHHFLVVLYFRADKATERAAVLLCDYHVMRHVYQTTRQVTCVGGLKSRVGKTFTRTVRRDEVFQHRKTLLEVCKNRVLDDLAALCAGLLRLGHKATHA